MANAKWSTNPREIIATSNPDGSFHAEVPLYDGSAKQFILTFDITPERVLRILVNGEPTGKMSGFYAWSDF